MPFKGNRVACGAIPQRVSNFFLSQKSIKPDIIVSCIQLLGHHVHYLSAVRIFSLF